MSQLFSISFFNTFKFTKSVFLKRYNVILIKSISLLLTNQSLLKKKNMFTYFETFTTKVSS